MHNKDNDNDKTFNDNEYTRYYEPLDAKNIKYNEDIYVNYGTDGIINSKLRSTDTKEERDIKDLEEEKYIGEDNIIPKDPLKRTMCDKYFSKPGPGSLRSSIFNLSLLAIGVGCLALPQKVGQLSLVLWSILILFAAFSTYLALDIIIEAGRKKELSVYAQVIEEYCGKKWGILYDGTIILYVFGVLITYQIIAYDLLGAFIYLIVPQLKDQYTNLDDFYSHSIWKEQWFKICVMLGAATIILLPLNLLKDISKLRFSSILGIFSIGIFAIVLCVQLNSFISQNIDSGAMSKVN